MNKIKNMSASTFAFGISLILSALAVVVDMNEIPTVMLNLMFVSTGFLLK